MTLESLLAYAHLLAILTMVVFLASEAALCRVEWLNAAVVERLGKIDMVYGISAGLVLLSGLARVVLGSKGAAWYAHNPLLYLKLAMFLAIGLISIKPTLMFVRGRRALRASGALPDAPEIKKARRLVMVQAHILPFRWRRYSWHGALARVTRAPARRPYPTSSARPANPWRATRPVNQAGVPHTTAPPPGR